MFMCRPWLGLEGSTAGPRTPSLDIRVPKNINEIVSPQLNMLNLIFSWLGRDNILPY